MDDPPPLMTPVMAWSVGRKAAAKRSHCRPLFLQEQAHSESFDEHTGIG
jgi:hypothetical protein